MRVRTLQFRCRGSQEGESGGVWGGSHGGRSTRISLHKRMASLLPAPFQDPPHFSSQGCALPEQPPTRTVHGCVPGSVHPSPHRTHLIALLALELLVGLAQGVRAAPVHGWQVCVGLRRLQGSNPASPQSSSSRAFPPKPLELLTSSGVGFSSIQLTQVGTGRVISGHLPL